MRRLGREDGLSLIELLIAMGMSLAIFGGALTMLVVFGHQQLGSTQRNDAQDRARLTIDLIARQLRNISSPISTQKLIERAAPYDVVFQTVGAPSGSNVTGAERVRYCIPNDPSPGSSSNEELINQTQTWTTASPPISPWSSNPLVTIPCPDTSTPTSTIVIPAVTNRYLGRTDRPAFLYDNGAAPSDLTKITSVQMDLFVNPTPTVSAAETELRSGVFLRNQIQAPASSFTFTADRQRRRASQRGHIVQPRRASAHLRVGLHLRDVPELQPVDQQLQRTGRLDARGRPVHGDPDGERLHGPLLHDDPNGDGDMNRLRRLSRDEQGFSLVVSILMLMIILTMSGAIIQTVVVQSHQSGAEVAGEASFNLAESALDAVSYQLAGNWPATSTAAYPTCNQVTTAVAGCPGTSLTSAFASQYAGVDFGTKVWNVKVIDDTGGSSYYNDSALSSSTTSWDSNADGRLWIRADATIAGKRRIVVAQMLQQTSVLSLPQNVITAGGVDTSNNGNKVIIEANDPASHLSGKILVQCSAGSVSYGSHCLGWDASKGQFDGSYQTWTTGQRLHDAERRPDQRAPYDSAVGRDVLHDDLPADERDRGRVRRERELHVHRLGEHGVHPGRPGIRHRHAVLQRQRHVPRDHLHGEPQRDGAVQRCLHVDPDRYELDLHGARRRQHLRRGVRGQVRARQRRRLGREHRLRIQRLQLVQDAGHAGAGQEHVPDHRESVTARRAGRLGRGGLAEAGGRGLEPRFPGPKPGVLAGWTTPQGGRRI